MSKGELIILITFLLCWLASMASNVVFWKRFCNKLKKGENYDPVEIDAQKGRV